MKRLYSHLSKEVIFLVIIVLFGFLFRTLSINWDSGYHFHSDERAIVMFALEINPPSSISEFLSPQSSLNPHFFAYGTFPIYLLRGTATLASYINPLLNQYDDMPLVGRMISALFDTATILIVFLIAKRIFSAKTGLFAAFFYSIAVLPIQLSHFFAVDTILTFFLAVSLLALIEFLKKPSALFAILLGTCVGLSLATKVSALIIGPVILVSFIGLLLARREKQKIFLLTIANIILAGAVTFTVAVATQPYVLIDWKEFLRQTSLQTQMSKDPYLFPYTLQYANKIPYLYELKNIFLWGLGPIIATFSFLGFIFYAFSFIKKGKKEIHKSVVILFMGIYFLVFGSFAVGWIRYMLPLYPLFAITAGYFIGEIIAPRIPSSLTSSRVKTKILLLFFYILSITYTFSFLSIYNTPNTRIQATDWILENIPDGSVLATEHWDDALPLKGFDRYNTLQLALYEKDSQKKWLRINSQLKETDYIIIASHRLYVPLQKLTDCNSIKPGYCYPQTAEYYKKLFEGKLGFQKIAEFSSFPKIPFLPLYINDFSSDENFTVFDHPKVMIFKKTR